MSEKRFKEEKDYKGSGSKMGSLNCFFKGCPYHSRSGGSMYDHLKIVHHMMIFEDRFL